MPTCASKAASPSHNRSGVLLKNSGGFPRQDKFDTSPLIQQQSDPCNTPCVGSPIHSPVRNPQTPPLIPSSMAECNEKTSPMNRLVQNSPAHLSPPVRRPSQMRKVSFKEQYTLLDLIDETGREMMEVEALLDTAAEAPSAVARCWWTARQVIREAWKQPMPI